MDEPTIRTPEEIAAFRRMIRNTLDHASREVEANADRVNRIRVNWGWPPLEGVADGCKTT